MKEENMEIIAEMQLFEDAESQYCNFNEMLNVRRF
jgi:hypothetical protein